MIWVILVFSFILRLITINQSLWLDESINVLAARDLPFWQFVTGYPIGDFHPPGYFAILWVWGHIFGFSEVSTRIPSVIFGVITVYITYLIAKRIFNYQTGIFSALLLAVAPLHIYYSQEARMYSFATFAATFSFFAFIKLVERTNTKNILLYSLSLSLVLYSDYVTYLIIPVQFLYLILFNRSRIKEFLLANLIGFAPFIPWLFVFPIQLENGIQTAKEVPGWKTVVGGSSFKNLALVWIKMLVGRISFDSKQIYAVIVGIFSLTYFISLFALAKKVDKRIWLFFIWLVVPILLAFLISLITPVLSYFRLIFILPAFYILIGFGITQYNKEVKFLLLGLIVMLNLSAVGIYYTNPKFQREDWRKVTKFLQQRSNNRSLVLFENDNLPAPYRYYQNNQINAQGGLAKFPANNPGDLKPIKQMVDNKTTIFVVEYLVGISDNNRLLQQELVKQGYKLKYTFNFNGVGFVYEYVK